MKIGYKLIIGFIFVAIVASISGIIGAYLVGEVAGQAEVVTQRKMPLQTTVGTAATALERIIAATNDYRAEIHELPTIRSRVDNARDRFSLNLTMIRLGTQSEDFRQSEAGRLYEKLGSDVVLPDAASGLLAHQAEQAITQFNAFSTAVNRQLEARDRLVDLTIEYEGRAYILDGFLLKVEADFRDWVRKLSDAARFNVEFRGNTDPEKTMFRKWRGTFTTTDHKLLKLLKAYEKAEGKFIKGAQKVNKAASGKKESNFKRLETRNLKKVEKAMAKIHKYLGPVLAKIDKDEHDAQKDLAKASLKISSLLEEMTEQVAKDVRLLAISGG